VFVEKLTVAQVIDKFLVILKTAFHLHDHEKLLHPASFTEPVSSTPNPCTLLILFVRFNIIELRLHFILRVVV